MGIPIHQRICFQSLPLAVAQIVAVADAGVLAERGMASWRWLPLQMVSVVAVVLVWLLAPAAVVDGSNYCCSDYSKSYALR